MFPTRSIDWSAKDFYTKTCKPQPLPLYTLRSYQSQQEVRKQQYWVRKYAKILSEERRDRDRMQDGKYKCVLLKQRILEKPLYPSASQLRLFNKKPTFLADYTDPQELERLIRLTKMNEKHKKWWPQQQNLRFFDQDLLKKVDNMKV